MKKHFFHLYWGKLTTFELTARDFINLLGPIGDIMNERAKTIYASSSYIECGFKDKICSLEELKTVGVLGMLLNKIQWETVILNDFNSKTELVSLQITTSFPELKIMTRRVLLSSTFCVFRLLIYYVKNIPLIYGFAVVVPGSVKYCKEIRDSVNQLDVTERRFLTKQ